MGLRLQDQHGLGEGQDRHRLSVRNQHELLLIAQRGTVPLPAQAPASVIAAPRLEHSAKPVTVCALIEAMHPDLPRVELFARQARLGWDAWGNEAPTPAPATATTGNAAADGLDIPDFLKRSPPLQAEQAAGHRTEAADHKRREEGCRGAAPQIQG